MCKYDHSACNLPYHKLNFEASITQSELSAKFSAMNTLVYIHLTMHSAHAITFSIYASIAK